MARPVIASEVGLYVDNVLIACAQDVTLNIDRAMLEAVCAGSGVWSEFTPGSINWNGDVSALHRAFLKSEVATNVGVRQIFAKMVAGTMIETRFGFLDGTDPTLDGFQFQGNAFWNNLSLTNPVNDVQTWTAAFQGTGVLDLVDVPAEA